jgi:hypothetical protein
MAARPPLPVPSQGGFGPTGRRRPGRSGPVAAGGPVPLGPLRTVTQVFTSLRYKDLSLLTILGGKKTMFESPLIREIVAESRRKNILRMLQNRFGPVPPGLEAEVRSILDETVLDAALDLATSSTDLEHFGAELRAVPRPPEPWHPTDEREPVVEQRGHDGPDA